MDDYYKLLGVAYDDPQAKIKARYRLLALTLHPDVATAEQSSDFGRYAQAYRVLGRPSERRRYNESLGILVKPRPLRAGTDLYQRIVLSAIEAEKGILFPFSFFRYEPCSLCWLSGCHRCDKQGMIAERVTLDIPIMAGTRHNAMLLVEGQGSASEPGGKRGNLIVYITIQ